MLSMQLSADSGRDRVPPAYWLKELGDRVVPGTVLLSDTVRMIPGVDQFADAWR